MTLNDFFSPLDGLSGQRQVRRVSTAELQVAGFADEKQIEILTSVSSADLGLSSSTLSGIKIKFLSSFSRISLFKLAKSSVTISMYWSEVFCK